MQRGITTLVNSEKMLFGLTMTPRIGSDLLSVWSQRALHGYGLSATACIA